eukprot:TRINITY_DN4916_c0_g1_i3.p1 TRINITY_DN4916_c0_g1~~TRINITY_DN4916_c0_g1_i3.p1  ORF type:complete len:357 (-),score=69.99 TRINITY_DN4916_c0_g1_i3:540-1610(-)
MGASNTKADIRGQQILTIQPNSPCDNLGLCPYSDFIVAADDVRLMNDSDIFAQYIKGKVGTPVTLTIYNIRSDVFRGVVVTPSLSWGGMGLLGVSIRPNDVDTALNLVWKVLEVSPKSPAFYAGLKPNDDFIIGSPERIFNEEADFYDLVEGCLGKELRLYVFNTYSEQVREVLIIPNRDWGGDDSTLGCLLGTGILHRVPKTHPGNLTNFNPASEESFHATAIPPNSELQAEAAAPQRSNPILSRTNPLLNAKPVPASESMENQSALLEEVYLNSPIKGMQSMNIEQADTEILSVPSIQQELPSAPKHLDTEHRSEIMAKQSPLLQRLQADSSLSENEVVDVTIIPSQVSALTTR